MSGATPNLTPSLANRPIARRKDDSIVIAERMRSIRGKNTRPERAVRRTLHGLGLRFRLHRRDLPGTPDITLPRHRAVVQVHGCFWHQHPGCPLAKVPKARPEYWKPKLRRNAARDVVISEELTRRGWRVLVVWECETRDGDLLAARLMAAFPTARSGRKHARRLAAEPPQKRV